MIAEYFSEATFLDMPPVKSVSSNATFEALCDLCPPGDGYWDEEGFDTDLTKEI